MTTINYGGKKPPKTTQWCDITSLKMLANSEAAGAELNEAEKCLRTGSSVVKSMGLHSHVLPLGSLRA